MAWYLQDAYALRFGTSRLRLEKTTTAQAFTAYGYSEPAAVQVTLYTCTATGSLTQRAQGRTTISSGAGAYPISLTVPADIAVPTNGGVALWFQILASGFSQISWYSPPQTNSVIAAGTHIVIVQADSWYDPEYDEWVTGFYYGSGTYAPDAICAPVGASYAVTYDEQGGSAVSDVTGATSFTPPASTRAGYTLSGWNTAANGSGANYAVGTQYTLTADLTLYAIWQVGETVSFTPTTSGRFYSSGTNYATVRGLSSANLSTVSNPTSITGQVYLGGATFYLTRSVLFFDTSSIPDDATISSVRLTMTPAESFGTGSITEVVTTTATSIVASSYAIANYGSTTLGTFPALLPNNTPYQVTLSNLTVDTAGVTRIGVRGKLDLDAVSATGANAVDYHSQTNATEAYRPKLEVTYSTTPSTTTVPIHLLQTRFIPPMLGR